MNKEEKKIVEDIKYKNKGLYCTTSEVNFLLDLIEKYEDIVEDKTDQIIAYETLVKVIEKENEALKKGITRYKRKVKRYTQNRFDYINDYINNVIPKYYLSKSEAEKMIKELEEDVLYWKHQYEEETKRNEELNEIIIGMIDKEIGDVRKCETWEDFLENGRK